MILVQLQTARFSSVFSSEVLLVWQSNLYQGPGHHGDQVIGLLQGK